MKTLFKTKVLGLTKKIPKGRVSTYKAIAEALHTRAYRAVGQALRYNPEPVKTPCHRVVGANGGVCGFMGQTTGAAIRKKIALLNKEGIKVKNNKIVDFEKKLYCF